MTTNAVVVPVAEAGMLRTRGSSALAATRFVAAAEDGAILRVTYPALPSSADTLPPPFIVKIWLNGKVVFNSTHLMPPADAPVRLRAGANTLAVSCVSNVDGAADASGVSVEFLNAKTQKPVTSLMLDMEEVKK